MASRTDLNKVVTIKDLLIDEDVWGFWDTREDTLQPNGRPYNKGVCFLVDNSQIFFVGTETAVEKPLEERVREI